MGQKLPLAKVPFQRITGVGPRTQWELFKNFEELANAFKSSGPFVTVASDGSGDFTSIKAAIDALPANAVGNDISGVIFVKWSSTVYNDSTNTVDISGKQVLLVGEGGLNMLGAPLSDLALIPMPGWTSGAILATSTGTLAAVGMDFQQTTLTTSTLVKFNLDHCRINALTNTSLSLSTFRHCHFINGVTNNVATSFTNVFFENCNLQAGWCSGVAGNTLYAGVVMFRGCVIFAQITTQWHGANGATGGDALRFDHCEFNVSANVTWSHIQFSTEDHISYVACKRNSSQAGILTMTFSGSGHGPQYTMSGNEMPYTDLSFTGTSGDPSIYISGTYRSITLAQPAQVNAVLDARGASTITLLKLNSGAVGCVINVIGITGSAITGYSIAAGANNNFITFGNLAGLTTVGTNSGTNNIINGTVGGSGVQLQSNWSQQFLLGGV